MSFLTKIKQKLAVNALIEIGTVVTINSQSVRVLARDSSGNVTRASGTVTVTDGGAGYAKGCLYVKTDAAAGTDGLYENIGTTSSCQFVQANAVIPSEIALTSGQMLVGNGSNVGAGVAMSGDATMDNAGVVTLNSRLLRSATVTITSPQLLALFTTPITIVAAQGANTVIQIAETVIQYVYNSVVYTINGSTNLTLNYTNAAGAAISTTLATTGLIDQASNQVRILKNSTTNVTPVANSPVVLSLATANPTLGNGTLVVTVLYRVVPV